MKERALLGGKGCEGDSEPGILFLAILGPWIKNNSSNPAFSPILWMEKLRSEQREAVNSSRPHEES